MENQQHMDMFGMPKEWLDELIADWQEPCAQNHHRLMGGLTMLVMYVLSDAQEEIEHGLDNKARQYINRAKYIIKQIEEK